MEEVDQVEEMEAVKEAVEKAVEEAVQVVVEERAEGVDKRNF